MFCRKCGQQIKEGAKFCTKCGMPVGQVQLQKNAQQRQQQPIQMQPSQATPAQEKKGGKGIIIALVCILIVVCAVAAGTFGYYYISAQSDDEKREKRQRKEEQYETETPTEAVTEKELDTELPAEAAVPEETPIEISEEELSAIPEKEPETDRMHEYRIVVKDVTWTEAFREAASVPNGYLVNINSEEEWDAILQQIYAEKREECIFWIGATRKANSSDYFWVDANGNNVGNSLNDSLKWLTGEPTYYDAENDMEENYVDMFFANGENRWVWNDTPNDLISLISYYSGRVAYIVEIEHE